MYVSNINRIVPGLRAKLEAIQANPDPMLRLMAMAVLPEMRKRVHVDGKDSDGQPLGTYTPGYMKVRISKYNRKNDKKTIWSLTRQMENDLSLLPVAGGYGLGFKNSFNYQKSQWLQNKLGRPVWNLSATEKDLAMKVAVDYFNNAVSEKNS